jgi:hypothetical protein
MRRFERTLIPMKHAFCLSVLVAALALPMPARADAWADFESLNGKYYQIDREQKGRITCHIRSSELDEVMQKIPRVGEMIADQIDSFSVTLRPDGVITFVTPRPKLDGGVIEEVEALDKALADTVAQIEKGVWHLLKGATSPKKEDVSDIVIATKDGKTHITLTAIDMDGTKVGIESTDTTDSGDADVTKETRDKEIIDGSDKYIKLDGKYALETQTMHSNLTEGVVDDKVQVKYQQLGKVWFPARLISDGHAGPKLKPFHAELSFTDCTGE